MTGLGQWITYCLRSHLLKSKDLSGIALPAGEGIVEDVELLAPSPKAESSEGIRANLLVRQSSTRTGERGSSLGSSMSADNWRWRRELVDGRLTGADETGRTILRMTLGVKGSRGWVKYLEFFRIRSNELSNVSTFLFLGLCSGRLFHSGRVGGEVDRWSANCFSSRFSLWSKVRSTMDLERLNVPALWSPAPWQLSWKVDLAEWSRR